MPLPRAIKAELQMVIQHARLSIEDSLNGTRHMPTTDPIRQTAYAELRALEHVEKWLERQ